MKGKERTKLPGFTGFFQITVGIGLFYGILNTYMAFSEYSSLFKTEYALLVGVILGINILEVSLSVGMLVLIALRKRAFLIFFWIDVADRVVALLLTLFLSGNSLDSFVSLIISAVWAFYFYYSDNFARAFTPYKKPPLNPDTKPQPVTAFQETAQQKQLVMDKANEQADAVALEPIHDASEGPIEEAKQAASILSEKTKADETKQKKAEKIRFCKYCGTQIKKEDAVCPNCGKRIRFRIKPKTALIGMAFLLCASLGFNIYQIVKASKTAEKMFAQEIEIAALEQTVETKERKISEIEDFMDNNVAFIRSDMLSQYMSSMYHTYDCPAFEDCDYFIVYNIEQAKSLGYRPCEFCH